MRFLICAIFSVTLLSCSSVQQGSKTQSLPLGLWVWSADTSDDTLSISVEENARGWRASIQSKEAEITVKNRVISVTGDNNQKYIGQISVDKTTISGYWHQPASDLGYQPVVTRAVIESTKVGHWQGTITPQSRPFNVFLDISQPNKTDPLVVVRNPEQNAILGSTQFTIEGVKPNQWRLISKNGRQDRRYKLTRENDSQLTLEHNSFDQPLSMTRSTRSDTSKYFSRLSSDRPEKYTLPLALDDGWVVATPEEAGFDRSTLDGLVSELANANPRARRPRMVHSMLVAHKGRLVFEEYFHGHNHDTAHDTRSLAKVFGPVLIGALQQAGSSISAQDRPINSVLEQGRIPIYDPRKNNITLAHLMTYTSGLDCSETSTSAGSEDQMWRQQEQDDFWLYTAQLPMLHEPGVRHAYCSGSINLVGSSIRSAAEAPIYETFDRLIASPLKFGPYHWNLAPNGASYLGGGVYMRPRDILKIGAVFANNGVWQGQQIINADWVEESTAARIDIESNYFEGSQAYIWHTEKVRSGKQTYSAYRATGNGGQILLIVPELDLAVVFTGGNYRMGGIWGPWPNEFVGEYIIPAIIK